MTTLRKYLLMLMALSSAYLGKAQELNPTYSTFPLKIAIGNHAVGFPYQNSFNAFNPHFSLGTELGLNRNPKHRLFTAVNLGFIRNTIIGNTITTNLELGYRYTHKSGLFLESAVGLGILAQFHPRTIYELDPTADAYQEVKDKGTFASLVGLKMGMGYDFSKNSKHPFSIGINHHFFIQTPYFDVENFPIMPQSTSNITITYKFKKQ